MSINTHQPQPINNANDAIWDLVMGDMKERDEVGRERYGTPLQGFNGRDALVDAYQEALDLVVYLRQAIWERDFGKEVCVAQTPRSIPVAEVAPVSPVRFTMTTESTFL
jgi:hypothetical protein